MLAERFLTNVVKGMTHSHLDLCPTEEKFFPDPHPGQKYMLYLHVPFCEILCPYCSFNRYVFKEDIAREYFANMRREMMMLKQRGWDFETLYFGGGTPTVLLDELCKTIDLARENFHIKEVGVETNPNHLVDPWLSQLKSRVQRLSVGVQSFNNDLLKQMERYHKYGSGEEIFERIGVASEYFDSVNVDMIFNFPSQTEDILINDLEKIATCGARQTTFSPLYVSNATMHNMQKVLGRMDWKREFRYYQLIDGILAGGGNGQGGSAAALAGGDSGSSSGSSSCASAPLFARDTVWTFCRLNKQGKRDHNLYAEELQVAYNEYPSVGSGSIAHLDGALYVNTFSLADYNKAIQAGHMSIMGKCQMSKRDLMRYYFLLHLYQLRLDKQDFKREFGCSIERGLPVEMNYMRAKQAFATDTRDELTLTLRGRYLILVLYRQFLSGMNNLRDQARAALSGPERELLFGSDSFWCEGSQGAEGAQGAQDDARCGAQAGGSQGGMQSGAQCFPTSCGGCNRV